MPAVEKGMPSRATSPRPERAAPRGAPSARVGPVLDFRPVAYWYENLARREVKSAKVYLTDSGILHRFLDVASRDDLLGHPKRGASWEGFAIQEVVRHTGARPEECFFWGLHTGASLDLLIQRGRRRIGFEIKLTTSPSTRRSMHTALATLGLEELIVVHAGDDSFPLAKKIRAVPLSRLRADLEPIR